MNTFKYSIVLDWDGAQTQLNNMQHTIKQIVDATGTHTYDIHTPRKDKLLIIDTGKNTFNTSQHNTISNFISKIDPTESYIKPTKIFMAKFSKGYYKYIYMRLESTEHLDLKISELLTELTGHSSTDIKHITKDVKIGAIRINNGFPNFESLNGIQECLENFKINITKGVLHS